MLKAPQKYFGVFWLARMRHSFGTEPSVSVSLSVTQNATEAIFWHRNSLDRSTFSWPLVLHLDTKPPLPTRWRNNQPKYHRITLHWHFSFLLLLFIAIILTFCYSNTWWSGFSSTNCFMSSDSHSVASQANQTQKSTNFLRCSFMVLTLPCSCVLSPAICCETALSRVMADCRVWFVPMRTPQNLPPAPEFGTGLGQIGQCDDTNSEWSDCTSRGPLQRENASSVEWSVVPSVDLSVGAVNFHHQYLILIG